jgi:hypothetical protein
VTYLIRYGAMGHVARFRATPHSAGPFHRGQAVVIQSNYDLFVFLTARGSLRMKVGPESSLTSSPCWTATQRFSTT